MISSGMSEFIERMTNLQNFTTIIREWPSSSTATLRDHVVGILPLGFLVVLLILCVKTLICSMCRGNRRVSSMGEEADSAKAKYKNVRTTKLSVLYKSSEMCSMLVLVAHLLTQLINVNRSYSSFNSAVYAVSAEVIQAFAWVITLVVLYRVQRRRPEKFLIMLRAWWSCNFAASLVVMVADLNSVITRRNHPSASDFVDFLALVATTWLFGISIRGKTGMACPYDENEMSELLPREKADKHIVPERDSPYSKATLFQLVTFSWLNQLFAVGAKKPLEQDDVPDVDLLDSAGYLSQSLADCLKQVKSEGRRGNPLYKAIVLFARRKVVINALFAVACASASYVGPYLIEDFVNFLSNKRNQRLESGYLLVLAFLGAKVVETISQRQWIFGARQLGLRLRATLISHIYQKGLHLSSQTRQGRTSGEIINYMSVDIQRITDLLWYLNIMWMLPIQITLAIYVLHMNLGPGSLAALAAMLVVMLCNIPLTRIQRRYHSKIMETKDDRMRTTSEVLKNMRTIKLQAWDDRFLGKLESLREKEYNQISKSLRLGAFSAFIFWGSPTFISVVTFSACMLMNIELTSGRVLSALATFRILQDPIFNLPDLLNVIAQAKVSIDRIATYLQEEEIQHDAIEYVPREESEFDVEIRDGNFVWSSDLNRPTLEGIDLRVRRGMKVAVCGTVGSGKSSLLSCILGEMQKVSGQVKVSGTKAYVPQSPWILAGDIRENILFGNTYDAEKYHQTVKACALLKDFELFSAGDRTEIGERGINMSGGQKQRIQIARSVYQDADIYLLDDPFSAVDAHTGSQLFSDCLMGILKEKTILYVTHQVEFLPAADLILVMQDGKIVQAGNFENLLKNNIGFEALVGAHNEALESILTVENLSRASHDVKPSGGLDQELDHTDEPSRKRHSAEENQQLEISEKGGKLMQDEERERGSIGKEVYFSYLTTVKGGALIPIILLAQLSFQVLQVLSNYWMAWASPPTIDYHPALGMNIILLVYVLLAVGSSLCILLRTMLVAVTGLWTAQKLFTNMLHSVFRAPMSFFDSTPTGRILNRVSTDQSILDLEMAMKLGWCTFMITQLLGTITVMSQVAWEVFVLFIPVTAICIWYQRYYTQTARELARISGIQQTPILHHFAESLAGATTIRAFDQEERFIRVNLGLIDDHSRSWFHNFSAMEWLSFRLTILSNFVFAFSLVLLVTLPEGIINPSIAGLAVTYGINSNGQQASVIWSMCNAENKIISVERILQYSKLASEAALVIEDCRPPINWPSTGTISFRNLQIRYAEHLPSVLKNITCTFPGRKKIGVVGRTGSGKSTLIQAIFRIIEPGEGSIVIDDVDICKIGLHDLRSRLSIIPQDPTMFEGTVRGNLDPLEQYSDTEIWEALDKCQLGEVVRAKEERLDYAVVENGENWSVGQRQLFCLGRALLKKSSILILDEATASVDSATDGVIQKVISREFQNRTVVTIAHRIHTVIDSDLVLVLSDGRIAEYDSPSKLLKREDSFFSKLIKEYSMRSKSSSNLHIKTAEDSHPNRAKGPESPKITNRCSRRQ